MKNTLITLALTVMATTASAGEFTQLSRLEQIQLAQQTMPTVAANLAIQHHCANEPLMLEQLKADFLEPRIAQFTAAQLEYQEIITPRIEEKLADVAPMGCAAYLDKMRNEN